VRPSTVTDLYRIFPDTPLRFGYPDALDQLPYEPGLVIGGPSPLMY